jgi:hypothetical protein
MGIESAMRQAGDLQSPDALYIGRADLPRRSWQKLMRKEVRSDLNSGEGAQPGSSNAT